MTVPGDSVCDSWSVPSLALGMQDGGYVLV